MHTNTLLSTRLLLRACTLGIVLSVAILISNAAALPQPKVAYTYSLHPDDGGIYYQIIADTPFGAGDADYHFHVGHTGDGSVEVLIDSPLEVTIEYTADVPGGNIVDGPVELIGTAFDRVFELNSGVTLVHTDIVHTLSRKGTGTLSSSTITWDNVTAPYEESVVGFSDCEGDFCGFATEPWPRDLTGTFEVILPTFTLFTVSTFGDMFVSDNGTPLDRTDDIDRPAVDATVTDTWEGISIPEPSGEILLLAGVLGLAGLGRLRERGGVFVFLTKRR